MKLQLYTYALLILVIQIYGKKIESLEESYKKGVQAYNEEKWSECIKNLEAAIHFNKLYNSVIVDCRIECSSKDVTYEMEENIDDLQTYDKFLKRAFCLLNCQKKYFRELNLEGIVSEDVFKDMADRKAYDYIQVCYFKMNLLPKAANAAHTYLVKTPDDKRVRNNYEFFIRQPEVDADEVIDLEGDDYGNLYSKGEKAYDSQNWQETVAYMEETLLDYFSYENKCRAKCEGPFNQGWHPDFVTNVANHYLHVLQCKQNCQKVVTILGYKSGLSFLADVLHHLQFAYYKLGKLNDTARAVESFLIIYPVHEDMLQNKKIYSMKLNASAFLERPEIRHYFNRESYEQKLLNYVKTKYETNFGILDNMIES